MDYAIDYGIFYLFIFNDSMDTLCIHIWLVALPAIKKTVLRSDRVERTKAINGKMVPSAVHNNSIVHSTIPVNNVVSTPSEFVSRTALIELG